MDLLRIMSNQPKKESTKSIHDCQINCIINKHTNWKPPHFLVSFNLNYFFHYYSCATIFGTRFCTLVCSKMHVIFITTTWYPLAVFLIYFVTWNLNKPLIIFPVIIYYLRPQWTSSKSYERFPHPLITIWNEVAY